jgi:hypothetical protein
MSLTLISRLSVVNIVKLFTETLLNLIQKSPPKRACFDSLGSSSDFGFGLTSRSLGATHSDFGFLCDFGFLGQLGADCIACITISDTQRL